MMDVIFLGTGGAVQVGDRRPPSIAIRRGNEVLIFDCGEGVQANFLKCGVGINREMKIFASHLHGDHILGLPGLIQSMSLLGRERELEIYGPKGIRDFIEEGLKSMEALNYEVIVEEIGEGTVLRGEYEIRASWVNHTCPCLAYAMKEKERPGKFDVNRAIELKIPRGMWKKLQSGITIRMGEEIIRPDNVLGPPRPGITIVYSGDTVFHPPLIEFARNADLLIHDSWATSSLNSKARQYGHSTSLEAAKVASMSSAKLLALFHISPRYYDDPRPLIEEAFKVFPNVILPCDMFTLRLK